MFGKISAVIGALFVAIALTIGFGYIGFSNDANRFENDIKAKYASNKNIYDNGWKAVKEMAQVPDIANDKLKDLYQTTLKARYGEKGSTALFQFIKEQNPNLDPALFIAVQRKIDAFRSEFADNQNVLVSKRQEYANYLTATTDGRFYNTIGGYPRIDLTKYDIVTSDKTEADFTSKRAEPLNLKQ